jgi:hypothetical protein
VASDSDRFALFAAAVLPAILLVGWFTFARLVQSGVESMRYLTRIQRIRRWYASQSPAGQVWFADLTESAGVQSLDQQGDFSPRNHPSIPGLVDRVVHLMLTRPRRASARRAPKRCMSFVIISVRW